ncbi:acyltransferase [Gordonia sp. GONU]|uniref:acyltransferase n=1 Tax=Gordonia sp. GONU TaxID=2972949 RepID=UPI0021AD31F3|nr:acyltransferase [Gordonia sp. GONU]MCR8897811.1 acyltransferase [Gordonia sp. GONU]
MHAAGSARTADSETGTATPSGPTTPATPSTTTAPVAAPVGKPRSRAHTADFVRVVLFTFVVVAHSVNAINGGPDEIRGANLVGTLCHLTRYGFVAVTLYVLVLSMQGREMSPVQFWRRRFGLVIGPYLAWTVIYAITDHVIIRDNPFPPAGEWVSGLAHDLLVGEGKYQLYFLLISMQIYLFFPLIAWIFERGRNRPWLLLSGGALIQIMMFVVFQYLPRPSGAAWDLAYQHLWKTLPMYALFVAMGVLAAQHQQAVDKWLREHMATVVLVAAGCAAFTVAGYLLATSPGNVPWKANTAWNPVSLPWLVGGFALLWLIGLVWDDRRAAGRPAAAKFVSQATLRAFGVFAVHPLILDILGRVGFLGGLFEWFPHSAIMRSLILIAVVLVSSLVLVDILLRLPFSKWLTARPRLPLLPKRREKKQDRAAVAETPTVEASTADERG